MIGEPDNATMQHVEICGTKHVQGGTVITRSIFSKILTEDTP